MPLPHPPLLLVTDRRQARGDLVDVVRAAVAGGCRWVSLREKDLGEGEQVALALRLRRALLQEVRLTVHGAPAVARRAGLDGVHLAAGQAPAGAEGLIGRSVHSPAEARAIDAGRVAYAVAGPFAETASKPGYGPALGRAGLAAIVAASPVPVLAIGGIEPSNVGDCLAAGAAGVAVMGSIMRAADPAAEMARLVATLGGAQPRGR